MGIDVSNSLLIGAEYDELSNFIQSKIDEDDEDSEYPLDENGVVEEYFDYASPYYDSPLHHQFIGFRIPNFEEPNEGWYNVVKTKADEFEKLTGVKAKIRGGAHVW